MHALIIGVDTPGDPRVRPLEFACADASALGSALQHRAEHAVVTTLTGAEATKYTISRAIKEDLARTVRARDTVLVYFAGYGSPELDGPDREPSIHLLVHGTEQERFHASSINVLTELCAWTRRLQANVVSLILDTSFNGVRGGRTIDGPGLVSAPRTRSLDRISPSKAAIGQQFALLTAASEKEVAREDEKLGHGVLTHHLIRAIRSSGASTMTTASLHAAVRHGVAESTGGEQNPSLHGPGIHEPLCVLNPVGLQPSHAAAAVVGS